MGAGGGERDFGIIRRRNERLGRCAVVDFLPAHHFVTRHAERAQRGPDEGRYYAKVLGNHDRRARLLEYRAEHRLAQRALIGLRRLREPALSPLYEAE